MDILPRATHPGNHKWTEPTWVKASELGSVTFESESLSSWYLVRSHCPLATEMCSTCVCVQLKTCAVLWATDIASWGAWGWKSHMFPLISHGNLLSELTHVRRLLCSGFEGQLFPSCSTGPTFLIAANNCHNYPPPSQSLWMLVCFNRWMLSFLFFFPGVSVGSET